MNPNSILTTKKLQGELRGYKSEIAKLRKQLQKMERQQKKDIQLIQSKLDQLSVQPSNLSNPTLSTINSQSNLFNMNPIGYLSSIFPEKNGTPRQGSICPSSKAKVRDLMYQYSI